MIELLLELGLSNSVDWKTNRPMQFNKKWFYESRTEKVTFLLAWTRASPVYLSYPPCCIMVARRNLNSLLFKGLIKSMFIFAVLICEYCMTPTLNRASFNPRTNDFMKRFTFLNSFWEPLWCIRSFTVPSTRNKMSLPSFSMHLFKTWGSNNPLGGVAEKNLWILTCSYQKQKSIIKRSAVMQRLYLQKWRNSWTEHSRDVKYLCWFAQRSYLVMLYV